MRSVEPVHVGDPQLRVLREAPEVAHVSYAYAIADRVEAYGWPTFPPPPPGLDRHGDELAARRRRGEALGREDEELVRAFSDWRARVTALESDAAKRLSALLWAARILDRHEPRSDRCRAIRASLARLYRVTWEGDAPTALEARQLANRIAVRLDVLPARWRAL